MAQSKPKDQGNTNTVDRSIKRVGENKKIRLLIIAAGTEKGDYWAFYHARKNVIKTYKSIDGSRYDIVEKEVKTAKDLVSIINSCDKGSIRSLDIFSHGGDNALYMTEGNPRYRSDGDGIIIGIMRGIDRADRWVLRNAALYRNKVEMVLEGAIIADSTTLYSIEANRFINNVKVELHGCNTAKTVDGDDAKNFSGEFSKILYDAGHTKAIVIGASEKSHPKINGDKTTDEQQDYRHGKRRVFRNGAKTVDITSAGHINENM